MPIRKPMMITPAAGISLKRVEGELGRRLNIGLLN